MESLASTVMREFYNSPFDYPEQLAASAGARQLSPNRELIRDRCFARRCPRPRILGVGPIVPGKSRR
jgi:hypothetical protein